MAKKSKKQARTVAKVSWKSKPAAHDYPAADSYLSLLVADPAMRTALVAQLEAAPIVTYKAKDLLRASQLPVLTKDNVHVALDLQKIRKKQPLSPVLLVRGDLVRGFPLQVADGYHRVCASHLVDENTDIPCRLIDLPVAAPVRARTTRVASAARVAEVAVAQVAVAQPPVVVEAPVPVKKVAAARRPAAPRKVAVTSAAPRTRKVTVPVKP